MWLDLRLGAKIKLTAGHNHQGAKQPSTMHVGARKGQKFHGEALRNVGPGRGSVLKRAARPPLTHTHTFGSIHMENTIVF
mgnify:CR=1 FL=1